jgi:hypothetical protein
MKFTIKKKVAKNEKDSKKLLTPKKVLNEKYVSTGYCSNGTPYINKKEVPILKDEPPKETIKTANLNTSVGSNSPKNLLYRLKNTTKMKHKSKQASSALGGNMGSKTLKSVGVSFGNLFKPSVRILFLAKSLQICHIFNFEIIFKKFYNLQRYELSFIKHFISIFLNLKEKDQQK